MLLLNCFVSHHPYDANLSVGTGTKIFLLSLQSSFLRPMRSTNRDTPGIVSQLKDLKEPMDGNCIESIPSSLQGGPLPVISGVMAPISRVNSPQLPSYFRPFIGAPYPYL